MRLLALAAVLLPQHGVLAPGKSLGGIRLGATPTQVERTWGRFHGTCRSCTQRTWYFTYRRFDQRGAGVEFRNGRVDAVFTLWQPRGWRTTRDLRLGDASARVTELYGALPQSQCTGYVAYTLVRRNVATDFYVVGDSVWGFGLRRTTAAVCR